MDAILTVVFAVTIFFCLPCKKRDYELEDIESRLPQSKYDELIDHTPGEALGHDPEFWKEVEGIPGLLGLVHESRLYSRIVQIRRKDKQISKKHAAAVWRMLRKQELWAIGALFETAAGHVFPNNHTAARKSVAYYCQIVIKTNTLCYEIGTKMCPITLPDLL